MIIEHRFTAFVTRHIRHWVLVLSVVHVGYTACEGEADARVVVVAYWSFFVRVRLREEKTHVPLQLIPPQPSLHSHDFPSSRRRRWSPSASESHSVSKSGQSTQGREAGKGRTRDQTIDAAPSRGTFALPIIRITVPVLTTCKDGEEAVEAWRALCFIHIHV
jgi:hypothetical protein